MHAISTQNFACLPASHGIPLDQPLGNNKSLPMDVSHHPFIAEPSMILEYLAHVVVVTRCTGVHVPVITEHYTYCAGISMPGSNSPLQI